MRAEAYAFFKFIKKLELCSSAASGPKERILPNLDERRGPRTARGQLYYTSGVIVCRSTSCLQKFLAPREKDYVDYVAQERCNTQRHEQFHLSR